MTLLRLKTETKSVVPVYTAQQAALSLTQLFVIGNRSQSEPKRKPNTTHFRLFLITMLGDRGEKERERQ